MPRRPRERWREAVGDWLLSWGRGPWDSMPAAKTALLRNGSSGQPSPAPPQTRPQLGGSLGPSPAGFVRSQAVQPRSRDGRGQQTKALLAPGPSPRGVAGQPRKDFSPQTPSTQLSFLYTHAREHVCCPLGPAPALDQRAALLTMIEKMRGMRLRGQTGQKQVAMARIR